MENEISRTKTKKATEYVSGARCFVDVAAVENREISGIKFSNRSNWIGGN